MAKTLYETRGNAVKTIHSDSSESDRLVFVTEEDVTPVLEYAKQMRAIGNWSNEMRPVAEIPMVIVEKLMQQGIWNDPVAMRRWLNDPDNKALRLWEGRV